MKNNVEEYANRTDLIDIDFLNNCNQARIVLAIDWEDKEVYTMTRNQIDGCPADVWNGLRWFIDLPRNTDATQIREWVQEHIMPVVDDLYESYDTRWDGSNWVGDWPDGYEYVQDDISRICESAPVCDCGGIWDASEWFAYSQPDITGDTTDEELEEMRKEIESEAEWDGALIPDLEDYLTDLREEKRSENA